MKILVDFIALIMLYVLCLFKKWQSKGKYALLVNTTMYVYLSCVLLVTLMPIITSLPFIFNHPYNMYLVPFDDYLNGRGDTVRQIVLNVIMTVPFGFLYQPMHRSCSKPEWQPMCMWHLFLTRSFRLSEPSRLIISLRLSPSTPAWISYFPETH